MPKNWIIEDAEIEWRGEKIGATTRLLIGHSISIEISDYNLGFDSPSPEKDVVFFLVDDGVNPNKFAVWDDSKLQWMGAKDYGG